MNPDMLHIRTADENDLPGILELYTHLHDRGQSNVMPQIDGRVRAVWNRIRKGEGQFIVVGVLNDKIIASCVLIVVPNLTHDQRPYALIENVVTEEKHRNKGYASTVLDYAKDIAKKAGCYKMMLMTGSKLDSTLRFYEKAGYNRQDKTAFVQWLD